MKFLENSKGQATIEYILVFSMLSLIAIGIVRTITGFMETTSEQMGSVLSHQLSSGYCRDNCIGDSYGNSILE